eukprot:3577250-Rhodomonas_salina.1
MRFRAVSARVVPETRRIVFDCAADLIRPSAFLCDVRYGDSTLLRDMQYSDTGFTRDVGHGDSTFLRDLRYRASKS